MEKDTLLLDVKCQKNKCPHFSSCTQIKTEVIKFEYGNDSFETHILFVGQGGGEEEAKQGRPFVGKSGQLLRSLIDRVASTSKKKLNYGFSNTVRCRPITKGEEGDKDKNRDPTNEEMNFCKEYLFRDIERLKPKLIVTLGKSATSLFKPDIERISDIRLTTFKYNDWLVLPAFHPSYVARNPSAIGALQLDLTTAYKISSGQQTASDGDFGKIGSCILLRKQNEIKDYVDFLINDTNPDEYVAFDTETLNLNKKFGNRLLMVQFSHEGQSGVVIPYQHPESGFDPTELEQYVKPQLIRLFNSKPKFRHWVAQNAKFDIMVIYSQIGVLIQHPVLCTQAFAFLWDENRLDSDYQSPFGLETLSSELLGFHHFGKMKDERGNLANMPITKVADYGAMDAYVTHRLFTRLCEIVGDYKDKALNILENFYFKAFQVFTVMENNGFLVDINHVRRLQSKDSPIWKRMAEVKEELINLPTTKALNTRLATEHFGKMKMLKVPQVFDIDKPGHLAELFFEELGLSAVSFTDKGAASIGTVFLQEYKDKTKEVELYEEYVSMKKLGTAYAKQIATLLDSEYGSPDCTDSRVRSNFNMTRVITGRTSSDNPNLQQLPKLKGNDTKKSARRDIRNMFIASPGCCLVQLDYMVSEVRWWCLISGDKNLAELFNKAKDYRDQYRANPIHELKEKAELYGDIHKMTASMMYEVPPEEVSDDMRGKTKGIVFGSMYGMAILSLAYTIHAKEMMACDRIFKKNILELKKTEKAFKDVPDGIQKPEDLRRAKDRILEKIESLSGKNVLAEEISKALKKRNELIEDTDKKYKEFFSRFPDAEKWMFWAEDFAQEHCYIESPMGIRRHLPEMLSGEEWTIGKAKRQARNSPIQLISSNAGIIGAFLLNDYIIKNNKKWKLQAFVHDSCVTEVPIDELIESVNIMEGIFTNGVMLYLGKKFGVDFICPLEVEFEISQGQPSGWGNLYKWDFSPKHLLEIQKGCK